MPHLLDFNRPPRHTRPNRPSGSVIAAAIGLALVAGATALPAESQELTVTFDQTTGLAPAGVDTTFPGGEFGPELSYGDAVMNGGVILLAITPRDQIATTLPNLYVTTDYLPLADGSLLPGIIWGDLAAPASRVTLNVGNAGFQAAEFTLTAFSGSSIVASDSAVLDRFGSFTGFTGELSVSAPVITRFEVTSDLPQGSVGIGVDTIQIVPLPEPTLWAALVFGGSLLAMMHRNRSQLSIAMVRFGRQVRS